MFRSIRSRLVALVLAVALPLLGVLLWVFWAEVSRVHNSARDLALRISLANASDLRDSNNRPLALLAQMANRPQIRRLTAGSCDPYFSIVDVYPQYLSLVLYDAAGGVVCSSTPSPADAPFDEVVRPLTRERIRSHPSAPEMMVVPVRGKWIQVLFEPVTDRGVVTGVLALEQYLDLDVGAYPTGTVITIVDGTGRIVARSPDGAPWVGRDARASGLGKLSQGTADGRAEARGVDGVLRQYGFTRVKGTDWTLFVGIPAGVARSAVRALVVRGVTAGLIICAVVVVLALWLAATIKSPLDDLADAARRVGDEGYSGPIPADGPREIVVVGQAFNRMIESRADAEKALIDSRSQLEALSKRLLDVQEEERGRIAREIHDEMGQLLTALKMDIGGLLKVAEPLSDDQKAMARRIREALSETMLSVQRIAAELRPPSLDDFGLVAAIESEVQTFEQRTGVECDLSIPDESLSLGPEVDAAIYRIVQEGMTNVARHSDATRVEIRLRHRGDELLVEIRDDGKGIDARKIHDRASLGIAGMRERARRLGGTLEVEGIEGRGTIVSVRIPLEAA